MVRLGIGMYGIGSDEAEQKKLRNVGTLRSRISQIKAVKKGETIGYNRKGVADTDKRIAVIPIGYADGFSRLLGNGRHGVYVQGQLARTVGNICMDMCMVDVTDINCREGDEVLVFSTTDQIQSMAEALGTIPYEVLTSVSARVRRIYTQE
jgi:alanine racemase